MPLAFPEKTVVLTPGARLGPYRILSLVGSGGMGEVYQARDERLDRVVAVKLLPPTIAADSVRLARFEREARTTASLTHPHICTLHDTGRDGVCSYFVIEYVEGETLQNRLMRGALPVDEALRYAVQVVEALDYAHRRRVLHRDIKPANIMLTPIGVKLLDFGLAAIDMTPVLETHHAQSDTLSLTDDGHFLGTLKYAAPEQLEGRPVDTRADLFAFGAVLYEMLTGRRAFAGDNAAQVIAAILSSDPPSVSALQPAVTPALDRLVSRLLAKDPDDRWQTARDVLAELRWIQEGRTEVRPAHNAIASGGWGLLALALVVGFGAGAVWLWNRFSNVAPAEQATYYRFEVDPPPDTTFGSRMNSIAVSPDGRHLAFVTASASGRSTLWIHDFDSEQTRPLDGTDGAKAPFWSPDSRSVAFEADGALKKVDLLSGVSETIAKPAGSRYGAAWSTDGTIVFSNHDPRPRGLFRVSSGGGTPVPLTTLDKDAHEIAHNWPEFLPDGRHYLYLSINGKAPASQLWLGSLGSSQRIALLSDVSNAQFASPGYLLFTRHDAGGALFAQPLDPSTGVLGARATVLVERLVFNFLSGKAGFSVSQNGVLVYRATPDAPLGLTSRSGDTSWIGQPGQYNDPAFSPDARTVAVAKVDPVSGASDIWLFDLVRNVQSPFTADPGWEGGPVWSPDGSELAYWSYHLGEHHLMVKRSDNSTSGRTLLTGAFSVYDWSPDGRFIAYQHDCCSHGSLPASPKPLSAGLFAVQGDSIPWTTLAESPNASQLRFSPPDGHWIAYQADDSGRWEVYLSAFGSGEGKRPVSTSGGVDPRWGGDGRELFYIAPDRSMMAVRISADGAPQRSMPQRLFISPVSFDIVGASRPYDVSRDGRLFVFAPGARSASMPITVMVNWPAKLKTVHR